MSLTERTYRTLLVSASVSFSDTLSALLPTPRFQPLCTASNVREARQWLKNNAFDFIIINSPLPDESGVRFSVDCCRTSSSVVMILVKKELYPNVYDQVAKTGVFTLPKPTSRTILSQAMDWMISSRERLLQASSMEERIAEIRVIDRAKCLLIRERNMTEPEAHHYIEKNAMDNCIPKREAAEGIIRLYS